MSNAFEKPEEEKVKKNASVCLTVKEKAELVAWAEKYYGKFSSMARIWLMDRLEWEKARKKKPNGNDRDK